MTRRQRKIQRVKDRDRKRNSKFLKESNTYSFLAETAKLVIIHRNYDRILSATEKLKAE